MNNYGTPFSGNGRIVNTANGIFVGWGGLQYGSLAENLPYLETGGRYFVNSTAVTNNIRTIQNYYLYKKN